MRILLARPRGFCAGVERAIEAVEEAIRRSTPPVYVRHAIVHNQRVIEALEKKGAVFVEELSEIPIGSRVIFSAHGVSPAIRKEALERNLNVIDATCPLVTKVHEEVKRYARLGYTIILIGHRNHVEITGTSGEAPGKVTIIETKEEAETVVVQDPEKVAYATQTTLSVEDTKEIIEALRHKFPKIKEPPRSDICYATQNRQDAVKELAKHCDIIFIVGSRESSNSNRMVEVARARGATAYLIERINDIPYHRLSEDMAVGISSGASTPEYTVKEVIHALAERWNIELREINVVEENIHFSPIKLC